MRIAVAGIHIECSTYSPIRTTLNDFRVLRGDELTDHESFRFLRDYPHQFLPTLHARALPGGPVTRDTYESLKAECLDRLRALGPVDGVYLAMHGAMYVDGMQDAEGDWIEAVRGGVGDDCLLSASYDLHGNISQRVIDNLDMLSAYRTAPHIDVVETQRRACDMLALSLEQQIRPILVWAPIPVLLPGERTSTEDEPAKSLYAALPGINARDGVMDASLLVGYVWADEARATASAVLTGTDRATLEREAALLARAYWDARDDFTFGPRAGSIAECVEWARQAATGPVILADSGDNPTAGGVGDRPDVLRHLLERDVRDALIAGIADEPATDLCFQHGAGSAIDLSIGGTLGGGVQPVAARAEVLSLWPGKSTRDRQAVVRVGGVTLVLTARRRPFHYIHDFTGLGLRPEAFHVVVVKSGYLSPELATIANPNLMALSPGAVDQDIERLPQRHVRQPTYPFQRQFEWEPTTIVSARGNTLPDLCIEVCVEGVDGLLAAQSAGANRIELCASLLEGGITPSAGVIEEALRRATIPVHVIVRPRGGDFLYSDVEYATMRADVRACREAGAQGVVFGILTAGGQVDVERMSELVGLARPMRVTCHRAFDMTRDPAEALEALIECGVDRVLTSGQRDTAIDGLDNLRRLNEQAAGRIVIMACGALTPDNIAQVRRTARLDELHFAALRDEPSAMRYRNKDVGMGGTGKEREYTNTVTDPALVRDTIQAAQGG